MLAAHAMAYLDLDDRTVDEIVELHQALDDEDEEVQVQIERNGPWHRQTTSPYKPTACGRPMPRFAAMGPVDHYSLRQSTYAGELCPECFTPFELELSDEANRKKETSP